MVTLKTVVLDAEKCIGCITLHAQVPDRGDPHRERQGENTIRQVHQLR